MIYLESLLAVAIGSAHAVRPAALASRLEAS